MKIISKPYTKGDYKKYIEPLTKNNMEQLFIENFGGWSDSVSEKKFHEILKNGFVKLFYIKNDFIGYVTFNTEKDFDNSILINDIHIIEKHQRKGYGTTILNVVINQAKKSNIKQLRVFVFKNNPAINFYKKHGFSETDFLTKSNTSVMRKTIT